VADFHFLDKRVQRTKYDLFHALFELLKLKKYETISIKEIVELARYSRGTFYAHYSSKDELLFEIIDLLFKEMTGAYRRTYLDRNSIDVQGLVDEPYNLLTHFKKYGEYYQILLGNHVHIDFRTKITNEIINIYMEDFALPESSDGKKVDENLVNRFYAYGLTGLILEWIEDDFPLDPKEFSVELVKTFQYSRETIQIKNKFIKRQ